MARPTQIKLKPLKALSPMETPRSKGELRDGMPRKNRNGDQNGDHAPEARAPEAKNTTPAPRPASAATVSAKRVPRLAIRGDDTVTVILDEDLVVAKPPAAPPAGPVVPPPVTPQAKTTAPATATVTLKKQPVEPMPGPMSGSVCKPVSTCAGSTAVAKRDFIICYDRVFIGHFQATRRINNRSAFKIIAQQLMGILGSEFNPRLLELYKPVPVTCDLRQDAADLCDGSFNWFITPTR